MHERCSKGRGRILEHGNNPPLRRAGARAAASLVLALSALALSGCAVQQTGPRGKMSIGLDNAALLGTDHAKFKLGDDSEGTLRSLNGVYSLKLERFFRVISLGKRKDVQLERAVQIGDRTVLVLNQLDERNCIKTAVLAIRGSEVLNWEVQPSNCRTLPTVGVMDGRLVLLYADHAFVYDNSKLTKVKLPPQPAVPSAAQQAAPEPTPPSRQPRQSPQKTDKPSTRSNPTRAAAANPSAPATSSSNRSSNGATAPTATPTAAASNRPSRTSSPPPLVFGSASAEEKPVVIHLE